MDIKEVILINIKSFIDKKVNDEGFLNSLKSTEQYFRELPGTEITIKHCSDNKIQHTARSLLLGLKKDKENIIDYLNYILNNPENLVVYFS